MSSYVSNYPAADRTTTYAHFRAKLELETDCSDVFACQQEKKVDFVLVDARGASAFSAGHIPGAINVPRREISQERMAKFAADTLFVVYCAGPHCNGADKAAMKLAQLGYKVKVMLGGITGWRDEGYALIKDG